MKKQDILDMINQVHLNPTSGRKKGEPYMQPGEKMRLKKKPTHKRIESAGMCPISILEAHNKLIKSQEKNMRVGKTTLEAFKESQMLMKSGKKNVNSSTKSKLSYINDTLNHSVHSSPMKELIDCRVEVSPFASNV